MYKKIVAMLLAVITITGAGGCSKNKETRYQAEFLTLFDTVTQIIAYTETKEEFSLYSQSIYDELKIYHELYDIYNSYDGINNIKTINDAAGKEPVQVDQKIIDLLKFSKEMYQKTNGEMNIAFGSVLRIWHEYRTSGIESPEQAELPPSQMLFDAAQHIDIDKMIIDEENGTVFLQDPEMSLDVGAVAKGYATEQVCRLVEAQGLKRGLVSVGGNVRAIGAKDAAGTPWNIGVQNPDTTSEQSVLYHLNLINASMVTSGNYERYYTVDGRNYHHIIDPDTLMPTVFYSAVVIICPDSGLADCLSTALFNMSIADGKALIATIPETEALWVGLDYSVQFSDHFEDSIIK
jgi:thiamine biosynthesis lipoprotein